eukprot:TRINITY_DN22810_c0_g1_i1.p1 TRINITY_DN22810_c0_g1~~TRINITY_DN22810_c0_g1_i1.p1  ORF type:complete len:620 (-),score=96.61 TRINITY_DN22810_c0_g1_i1:77-1936(-)
MTVLLRSVPRSRSYSDCRCYSDSCGSRKSWSRCPSSDSSGGSSSSSDGDDWSCRGRSCRHRDSARHGRSAGASGTCNARSHLPHRASKRRRHRHRRRGAEPSSEQVRRTSRGDGEAGSRGQGSVGSGGAAADRRRRRRHGHGHKSAIGRSGSQLRSRAKHKGHHRRRRCMAATNGNGGAAVASEASGGAKGVNGGVGHRERGLETRQRTGHKTRRGRTPVSERDTESESTRPRKRRRRRGKEDDGDKHIQGKLGEHVEWHSGQTLGPSGRYVVDRLLGDGVFGRVLSCRDSKKQEVVAVKVAGQNKRAQRQVQREADMLRRLSERDPALYRRCCPFLLDMFVHPNQGMCLVVQPLAANLQELVKSSGSQGLFLTDIAAMTRQLLTAISFVHSTGFAHTDIKCTNVMLRHAEFEDVPHPRLPSPSVAPRMRRPCQTVLIDFGGAAVPPLLPSGEKVEGPLEDSRPGVRVGARQIRAPEIILGLNWSVLADLWSLGCMLTTLYTGERLFKVHDDMEHIAVIEHLLQVRVPRDMMLRASSSVKAKGLDLDSSGRLQWTSHQADLDILQKVAGLHTLKDAIKPQHGAFLEMLRGLLEIRPERRLSAQTATKTSFLNEAAPLAE